MRPITVSTTTPAEIATPRLRTAIEARRARREADKVEIERKAESQRLYDRNIERKPVSNRQRWRMGASPSTGSKRRRR